MNDLTPFLMRVAYHTEYFAPLPERHPFPMGKFPATYRRLCAEGITSPAETLAPDYMPRELLELVHAPAYLDKLFSLALTPTEERRFGLPWSEPLLKRSLRAVHGTLLAARAALEDGIAGNCGGGTHHAMADQGKGYCVFADVPIAIRALRAEGRIHRTLVVDLDVHHGDGTASILADDREAFTFSMHGEKNYPARKPPSSLDVGLDDGTDDVEYLRLLERFLPHALADAAPDVVFYLGGVDVCGDDRYGRLALTRAGLRARDERVVCSVRDAGIPLVLLLAGGYARTAELTADLHCEMYRAAHYRLTRVEARRDRRESSAPHPAPADRRVSS
jgi:acetoin utilization deacetylase AcuC-like enzyme